MFAFVCAQLIQQLLVPPRSPSTHQPTNKSTSPPYRLDSPLTRRQSRRTREPSIKIALVGKPIDDTDAQAHFDVCDALLLGHRGADLPCGDEEAEDVRHSDVDARMLGERPACGPYRRRKSSKWRSFSGVLDHDNALRIPRQTDRFQSILDSIQRMVRDADDRKLDWN